MNFEKIRLISRRIFAVTVLLTVSLLIAFSTGCTGVSNSNKTATETTGGFEFFKGNLKKRVGVASFENKTLAEGQRFELFLQTNLSRTIQKDCPEIILETPGDAKYQNILRTPPKMGTGRIDNFALSMAGRELGFNAIVAGALLDISGIKEKHGILWFKSSRNFLQIQIAVEVYDTETGAKILDEVLIHQTEVDESDFQLIQSKNIHRMYLINDEIVDIATEMGEKVCDAVADLAWSGYISSINGGKIVISSGSNIGVRLGNIFEVRAFGKIIKGVNGHQFVMTGKKSGKIQIVSVYPDRSEAVLLSGNEIRVGSPVRRSNK
ncbi:MAG TPA: hypothetical protein ENI07_16670 [Desulfobacterales bacterium]|nr:hypothetical protein [Desulfobacterales bacterium]